VLERAGSTDPEAVVDAIRRTRFAGGLMVAGGPVVFDEQGDNPNASTAMVQILGQKPGWCGQGRRPAEVRLSEAEAVGAARDRFLADEGGRKGVSWR
jgi:ABC-type branched-subunit amino acid transport system substrate-binding protein